jgi:hypothetical protein
VKYNKNLSKELLSIVDILNVWYTIVYTLRIT